MSKRIKITYNPDMFSDFEGTQEELDDLVKEIEATIEELDASGELDALEELIEDMTDDEVQVLLEQLYGNSTPRTLH